MRSVDLGRTGLRSSVLGFGCAAVLGRAGRSESLRALNAAYDAGITFYDTARSYGYGDAEGLLGEFLPGKRHRIVLSTKFGIVAARPSLPLRIAKPIARKLVTLVPNSRKFFRGTVKAQFTEGQFSASLLRASIETSLRELRTDYVDFLFAHLPPPHLTADHELMRELEKLLASGKVRALGVSSDRPTVESISRSRSHPFSAWQFPCNLFDGDPPSLPGDRHASVLVANHPFGGAGRVRQGHELLASAAANPHAPESLRRKLREGGSQVMADAVLNSVLQTSGAHVLVPAMMNPLHLKTNVNAIERSIFDPSELHWIKSKSSEISAAGAA